MKKQSQAAIGRALGLSPASMTKLKGMGMPVDSVHSATVWRENNIRLSVSNPVAPIRNKVKANPLPSAAVGAACSWMNIAAAALAGGQNIKAMVPQLRLALANVPVNERELVLLDADVMDLLTADVAAVLSADASGSEDADLDEGGEAVAMDDDESEYMGQFWYKVAAGEFQVSGL